jgi:hypothetical protein
MATLSPHLATAALNLTGTVSLFSFDIELKYMITKKVNLAAIDQKFLVTLFSVQVSALLLSHIRPQEALSFTSIEIPFRPQWVFAIQESLFTDT